MLPLFQVKNRKFKELRINEIYELLFYTCMNTYCMQYKFCSLLLEILFGDPLFTVPLHHALHKLQL